MTSQKSQKTTTEQLPRMRTVLSAQRKYNHSRWSALLRKKDLLMHRAHFRSIPDKHKECLLLLASRRQFLFNYLMTTALKSIRRRSVCRDHSTTSNGTLSTHASTEDSLKRILHSRTTELLNAKLSQPLPWKFGCKYQVSLLPHCT